MKRELIAQGLIDEIFDVAVKRGLDDVRVQLNFATDTPTAQWSLLSRTFNSLDQSTRDHVMAIIREAITNSVTSVLTLIEGTSGYTYIGDTPCEISLKVRVYEDENDALNGKVKTEVALTPVEAGEDLHDMFLNKIEASYSDSATTHLT